MNNNKSSTSNAKRIKAKKIKPINLNLKKWRWLFLGLMKYPFTKRQLGNKNQKNLPHLSNPIDITPWDDDESKTF